MRQVRPAVRSLVHLLQMSGALVVRVERVPAPAVLGRRVVSTAVTAVTAVTGRARVHLVRLAPKLPEPAGERAPADTTAAAHVYVFSVNKKLIAVTFRVRARTASQVHRENPAGNTLYYHRHRFRFPVLSTIQPVQ